MHTLLAASTSEQDTFTSCERGAGAMELRLEHRSAERMVCYRGTRRLELRRADFLRQCDGIETADIVRSEIINGKWRWLRNKIVWHA